MSSGDGNEARRPGKGRLEEKKAGAYFTSQPSASNCLREVSVF
jgi:hypothetical protein